MENLLSSLHSSLGALASLYSIAALKISGAEGALEFVAMSRLYRVFVDQLESCWGVGRPLMPQRCHLFVQDVRSISNHVRTCGRPNLFTELCHYRRITSTFNSHTRSLASSDAGRMVSGVICARLRTPPSYLRETTSWRLRSRSRKKFMAETLLTGAPVSTS